MDRRQFTLGNDLELQVGDEELGSVSGVALVYNKLLSGYDEIITKGAGPEEATVQLIRGHDFSLPPLGTATLTKTARGFKFNAIYLDAAYAQEARKEIAQLTARGVQDVSVGIGVTAYRYGEELTEAEKKLGARGAIDDFKFYELSVVPAGAAPGAEATRANSVEADMEAPVITEEQIEQINALIEAKLEERLSDSERLPASSEDAIIVQASEAEVLELARAVAATGGGIADDALILTRA